MMCHSILFILLLHSYPAEAKTFHQPSTGLNPFTSQINQQQSPLGQLVAMSTNPFSSIQPRPKLPIEPDEFDPREVNAYYDWRNDLFFREFDLMGSGSVNFMTARRTYKVWLDEFGTPVVLTMGDPVFYWIDLNGNGKFEQGLGEMFKDSYEDGVTGNEEPYDNSDLQKPAGPGPEWAPRPH
ncbi:MAG: hypothetical protein V3T42_07435 [Nitrospirales bacterium]